MTRPAGNGLGKKRRKREHKPMVSSSICSYCVFFFIISMVHRDVLNDSTDKKASISDQEVPTLSREFLTDHATAQFDAVVPSSSNVTQKLEDVKNIIAEPEEYWRVNKDSNLPTSTTISEESQQV